MKCHYYLLIHILFSSCNSTHEVTTSSYSNGNPKTQKIYHNKYNKSNFILLCYYETSEVELKATVKDNKFIGERITFYKNGIMKEIDSIALPCESNIFSCDGKITTFDSLGKISEFWYYKNGSEDGLLYGFRVNGKVDYISTYVAGKKHGIEKVNYESGNLEAISNYINDTIVDCIYFFKENGDTLKYYNHVKGKMAFPYKKWLENSIILYGNYLDKSNSKALWVWYDENYRELKRLIKVQSEGGFVAPE